MTEKKPTTKAHRGFIHIRKRGEGTRPRPPRDPFRPRIPRDPFNPFRPRRPIFPFGRGPFTDRPFRRPRLGPADEPLDRLGRPIRSPIQGGRRRRPRLPIGIRPYPGMNLPTVEPQPIRRRRRRQRRLPQMVAGLGSLDSSIFNRAARAQRRAKGGMAFKSKDYVNPSNTVDNKKK